MGKTIFLSPDVVDDKENPGQLNRGLLIGGNHNLAQEGNPGARRGPLNRRVLSKSVNEGLSPDA